VPDNKGSEKSPVKTTIDGYDCDLELHRLSRREKSDFLEYQDSQGRFADFHCLRHTFITNLARANVSPKTAQSLARHSDIRLTMDIYTHVEQEEQATAIRGLPSLV